MRRGGLAVGALYRITGVRGTFHRPVKDRRRLDGHQRRRRSPDAAAKSVTRLDSWPQLVCYSGMVVSSFLIAAHHLPASRA